MRARPISTLPLGGRRLERPEPPTRITFEPEGNRRDEYDELQMSRRRPPVYWGGFFISTGELISTFFARLPRLRVAGDFEQNPEVILITGAETSQQGRTGKTTLATHFWKYYAMQDSVQFPIFYFGTGDEILAKYGVEHTTPKWQIDKWKREWWRRGEARSRYRPKRLLNVYPLCPPYKPDFVQEEVINAGGRVLKFQPQDITTSLLLGFSMLRTNKGGEAPIYMKLALKVGSRIEGNNLSREEAIEIARNIQFEDGVERTFLSGYNKTAVKKVIDAINEVYSTAVDDKAPTFDELILKRKNNAPFNYIIYFKKPTPIQDRFFAQHITELIMKYNEKYADRMYPKSRYVPPVPIYDEAGRFIPPEQEGPDLENPIITYINVSGKYRGPTVIISQYKEQIHHAIINPHRPMRGAWTHWFECGDFKALYRCKLMKRQTIEGRRIDSLSLDTQMQIEASPLKWEIPFTIRGRVKPPEIWQPT